MENVSKELNVDGGNKASRGFGIKGWVTIAYIGLMFWLYVGMVNDGANITAAAFAEKIGVTSDVILSMGTPAGFASIIFFIFFGKLNVKIGAKYTSVICMLVAGVSYILLGLSTSVLAYGICLCFVSGSAMSGGYIAGGALIAQWFPKKKGMAMGYASFGHNLASALYVPMISILVAKLGISGGVVIPGIIAIVVAVIGLLYIKNTPMERGLYPDNATKEIYETEYCTDTDLESSNWTTAKLLRTKEVWLAGITTGMFQLVTVGVMSQLVIRNMELGFTLNEAIGLMTVVALIGLPGSWLCGLIDEKFGTKKYMIIFALWYIVALAVNLTETKMGIYISILMIGIAIGGSDNATVSLPTSIFGRQGYAKANSVVFPIQGLVTAFCFLFNAISLSLTGSLRGCYAVSIGLLIINIFIITRVDEYKYNCDMIDINK
jgi:OFA family oxalate/formate antiporter-like MFS transporter